jgi:hypothetical protein
VILLRRAVVIVLVIGLALVGAPRAGAGGSDDLPAISLSERAVHPGDHVLVTITGFTAPAVTLTVCGNLAARRSMDCNQTGSEGRRLNGQPGATVAEMPIGAPPATCPCVLVVSTTDFAQVASAPIEILGHPTGPVVGLDQLEALRVEVHATKAPRGVGATVRGWLGGPTAYDVEVAVSNRSAATLSDITVAGAAGRNGDEDGTDIPLPTIDTLGPGERWTHTAHVTVPSPILTDVHVEVTASGTGPSVTAEHSQRNLPPLLLVLLLVLIADLIAIIGRRVHQRRNEQPEVSRRDAGAPPGVRPPVIAHS